MTTYFSHLKENKFFHRQHLEKNHLTGFSPSLIPFFKGLLIFMGCGDINLMHTPKARLQLTILKRGSLKQPRFLTYLKFENRLR